MSVSCLLTISGNLYVILYGNVRSFLDLSADLGQMSHLINSPRSEWGAASS
jgi:hypothetical protein